ncbi:MAG: hypothetical protein BWY85_00139 [Firmicutes bacterium ADurb.Bin506]|nr:MAG: hypothetical protein BWY85_00139 [Firmicutes bacterium ADurb.Bin506]
MSCASPLDSPSRNAATFAAMLADLSSNVLQVCLVPSRVPEVAARCGMIRAVISRNPLWYRKLCARYSSRRRRRSCKPDTRIKRANVLAVLERLSRGLPSRSPYVSDLLDLSQYLDPSLLDPHPDDFVPF